MNSIKSAFVSIHNPADTTAWSGTIHAIQRIAKQWGSCEWVGPIPTKQFLGVAINKATQKFFHKSYNYQHAITTSFQWGKHFKRRLEKGVYDLIVAPAAATEIANLEISIPIVYIVDATFSLVLEYYKVYSNLLGISKIESNWVERSALKKASLILSASEWARQSIIDHYGIDSKKVVQIPFGANLENIPSRDAAVSSKNSDICRLLFLGVDWERKGGSIAFDTMLQLERRGVNVQLTVCGCSVPPTFHHPKMRIIPFLNKSVPSQCETLYSLFSESDFFIMPTRAEAFGLVFCEASAFGVPSVATETGGIPSAIISGKNGFLLPLEASGSDFAELIHSIWSDKNRYADLRLSTRSVYETKLNWNAWGSSARMVIWENLGI